MPQEHLQDRFIIGVDLGGTTIIAGAMPADGSREIGVRTTLTRGDLGADTVSNRIVDMIETVIGDIERETGAGREAVLGVGIGSPGPLNRADGVIVVAPNLGWQNYPLRDIISERTGLRAILDNDANCATLGEWWRGAAQGSRITVGLTIGTGIGGGIIIDGKLLHGASDAAGEIGHASIDSTGRRCKCGNYGCLEAYCSGPAIAERAREALEAGEPSLMRDLANDDLSQLSAAMVYEAGRRGDPVAQEVMRDTARFLGTGIANLLNVFNPDTVVLAGGVTQAGDTLFNALRAEVRKRAFRQTVEACRIVPGALPVSAGVVGAVATFKQEVLGSLYNASHE